MSHHTLCSLCSKQHTLHYVLKSISTSTILVDLDLPVPVCELQRGSWPAVPWWSLPAHPEAAEVSPVLVLVSVVCPEPSAAESAAAAVPPAPVSDLHPETETRTISHILIFKYNSLKKQLWAHSYVWATSTTTLLKYQLSILEQNTINHIKPTVSYLIHNTLNYQHDSKPVVHNHVHAFCHLTES